MVTHIPGPGACFWFMARQSSSYLLPMPVHTWPVGWSQGKATKSVPGELLMSSKRGGSTKSLEGTDWIAGLLTASPTWGFLTPIGGRFFKDNLLEESIFRKSTSSGKLHFPSFSFPWPYFTWIFMSSVWTKMIYSTWILFSQLLPALPRKNMGAHMELYFAGIMC